MTTDTTEPVETTGETDGYRRTVLRLRVAKLALGVLVSALTALELLGVI